MPSNRRGLIWILLALVALLLVIAAGSVVAYLVLRARPAAADTAWQDPVTAVAPDKIAPESALYSLAGASDWDTIDVALRRNQPDTAYAILTFSLGLTDAQRSGRLLSIADQFREAGDEKMARLVYQQVYDVAVLSPELSDPLRADALLSAGQGQAKLEQAEQAMTAYDQAYTIAVNSPYLQTAHRRDLLTDLAAACLDLGREDKVTQYREQLAALDQGATVSPAAILPDPLGLVESQESVSSVDIGALEETRRQAGLAVLSVLETGQQPTAEQLAPLSQALQAEDQAKLALYRQELDATSQPGRRVDVHWAMLRWLELKYQVAMKGFGLSLVLGWEAQAADIRSELSKAFEALRFDYEDIATSLPDASLLQHGRYQVWRWLTITGRLGQYPNYPEEQMAAKLQEAARGMIAAGTVAPLYVDVRSSTLGLHFFLSPAATYGQAAETP